MTNQNLSSSNTQQNCKRRFPAAFEPFIHQLKSAKASVFLLFVSLVCFVPFFYTGYTIGLLDIQPFWIRGVLGVGLLALIFSFFMLALYGFHYERLVDHNKYRDFKIALENKIFLLCILSAVLFLVNMFIARTQTYYNSTTKLDFNTSSVKQINFKVHRPEPYNIEIELSDSSKISDNNFENILCVKSKNEYAQEQVNLENKNKCSSSEILNAHIVLKNETETILSAHLSDPITPRTIITPTLRRFDTITLSPGVNYNLTIETNKIAEANIKKINNLNPTLIIEATHTTKLKNLTAQKWYRYYWRFTVLLLVFNLMVLGFYRYKTRGLVKNK